MSKANQLRQMQEEINTLQQQLREANATIQVYKDRSKATLGDYIINKKGGK